MIGNHWNWTERLYNYIRVTSSYIHDTNFARNMSRAHTILTIIITHHMGLLYLLLKCKTKIIKKNCSMCTNVMYCVKCVCALGQLSEFVAHQLLISMCIAYVWICDCNVLLWKMLFNILNINYARSFLNRHFERKRTSTHTHTRCSHRCIPWHFICSFHFDFLFLFRIKLSRDK